MRVDQLIADAARQLNDREHGRWSKDDLLAYLNQALVRIVSLRPQANAVLETLELVPGTRQALPNDALRLLDIPYSLDADGAPSRALRLVDPRLLRVMLPTWHSAEPCEDVREACQDPAEPTVFYVYPPAREGVRVAALFSRAPRVSLTDEFPLADTYSEPALAWMIGSALAMDTGDGSFNKGQAYYNDFYQAIAPSQRGTEE